MKHIKFLLKVFYIKWIKGQCHQSCAKCQWRVTCWDSLKWEMGWYE